MPRRRNADEGRQVGSRREGEGQEQDLGRDGREGGSGVIAASALGGRSGGGGHDWSGRRTIVLFTALRQSALSSSALCAL